MGQKASLYYSGKEFSSSANVREAQLAEHEVITGSDSLLSLWERLGEGPDLSG
jgi:hypothetical protein